MNNNTFISNHFHLCAMWAGFKAYHMGTKEEAEAGYIPPHQRKPDLSDIDLLPGLYWVFGLGEGALFDNNEETEKSVDMFAVIPFPKDDDGIYKTYAESADAIGTLAKRFMIILRKGWSKMYPGSTNPAIRVVDGSVRYKFYLSGNANSGGNVVMRFSFSIKTSAINELKIACPEPPTDLHELYESLPNGVADLERLLTKTNV